MEVLERLKLSKFRNSFHLKQKDFEYIDKKSVDVIRSHAVDFVMKHLVDPTTFNDGKQTPTHGHPVFVAQYATATCCRGCLQKWHHIEKTHVLNESDIEYVVNIIMTWIDGECKNSKALNEK